MAPIRARALAAIACAAFGCGPAPRAERPDATGALAMLPDVRTAKDRPPVVLVARQGDPAAAVALAVTTSGLDPAGSAEPAVALAGVLEARLTARGLTAAVTPAWDGYRASVLVGGEAEAGRAATVLAEALGSPVDARDVAVASRKLAALAQRPLPDRALARWARCVGSPYALTDGAGNAAVTAARLEAWRAAAHGLPRVALAAVGAPAVGEAVAAAIARGRAFSTVSTPGATPASEEVAVYEATASAGVGPAVHATLDVGTSSAAVVVAEALGDPRGPLASRLESLDPSFRIREVTGSAHPDGGCVGVVLEAPGASVTSGDLAERVADAVALVQLETQVHLAERGGSAEGRTLARRAGDAREAAERGAWWALVDVTAGSRGGSIALGVPARRASPKEAGIEPSREALASSVTRAREEWKKPALEARWRIEPGQGESWVLLASPCGVAAEAEADAGLTALFTVAAAEAARSSAEARVEPWVVADGAGLLVHGPALPGETPAAHARRLADVVARSFASDPLPAAALARARADLRRRSDGALVPLAAALAPSRPSWILPWGGDDALARSSDAAVRARGQALRAGPLRVAVLGNVDEAQARAAVRAADRWVDRSRGGTRACGAPAARTPARAGTYAAGPRPGAVPEVYLGFPFPAGDEAARAAADAVVAALDGRDGLLARALGDLAREAHVRVLGWPWAPALVVRVAASQDSLDGAVMQARALVDRLHRGGLPPADVARAHASAARDAVARAMDPRARIVATWRGDAVPTSERPHLRPPASLDAIRAFAQAHLGEDGMVVVAARPERPAAEGAP